MIIYGIVLRSGIAGFVFLYLVQGKSCANYAKASQMLGKGTHRLFLDIMLQILNCKTFELFVVLNISGTRSSSFLA